MAEATKIVSDSIATRVIVVLIVVVCLFTLFSIAVLTLISHNPYAASYYSLSALFDANNEGSSAFIAAAFSAGQPTYIFYGFVAISLVDGLAKAAIIGFLVAAFINLLSSIDLKSRLEIITAKHLTDHVIVCGYSMLAERLSNDLKKSKIRFVIIEKDLEKSNQLRDLGFNVVEGDFTDKKVLNNASISKAKAIIFTTESDFVNLLGILTAHHMEPKLKIITRARSEASVRKMQRGGAGLCLVPEVVAGIELGERITRM